MTDWKKQHQKFIDSPEWSKIRNRIVSERKCCESCGQAKYLHVHHRNYERFGGQELEEDLVLFCENCHEMTHYLHSSSKMSLAFVTDFVKKNEELDLFRLFLKENPL